MTTATLELVLKATDQASAQLRGMTTSLGGLSAGALNSKIALLEASANMDLLAKKAATTGTALDALKAEQAAQQFQKLESASTGVGAAFAKVQIAGLAVTAAFAGVSLVSTKLAIDFEHATTTLQNQAGLTDAAAKQVSAAILDMGRSSLFSAGEMINALSPVAGRLQTLTSATLTTATAQRVLKGSSDLAAASQTDLKDSTSALVSVMLAYKIPLSEAAKASDELFNTSRITGVGIAELATAVDRMHEKMGVAAPSLRDTGALVAEVAAAGLSGSRGLLAVTTAVDTLTSGSNAVDKTLHDLGIGVFDAQGKFIGLRNVIAELAPVYAKLTEAQQAETSKALFGSQVLTDVIKAGLPAFDTQTQRVSEQGTAAEAARRHQQDLAGQITILKNDVDALAIAFGERLTPAVVKVVDFIHPLAVELEQNSTAMTVLAIVAGGVVVAALAVATIWFANMAAAAVTATAAIVGLEVAASGGLLLIPLALAAVAAAGFLLGSNWKSVLDGMRDEAASAGSAIENIWSGTIRDILPQAPAWGDSVNNAFYATAQYIDGTVFPSIESAWAATMNALPGYVDTPLGLIEDKFTTLVGHIQNGLGTLAGKISDAASAAWMAAQGKTGQSGGSASKSDVYQGDVFPWTTPLYGPSLSDFQPTPPVRGVVPPDPTKTGGGGGSTAANLAANNLEALAAAFAQFNAQTGGTIQQFQALLKVGEDHIALNKRAEQAAIALNARQLEAADGAFQMQTALVAIAELFAKVGEAAGQLQLAEGALAGFQSALDKIINEPTREGTQQQLQLDILQRTKDQMLQAGAKPGDKRVAAIDAEIKAIQEAIALRKDDLAIEKDKAVLANAALSTVANQNIAIALTTIAIAKSGENVDKFAGAAFFAALTAINLGNAFNDAAANVRSAGSASLTFAQQLVLAYNAFHPNAPSPLTSVQAGLTSDASGGSAVPQQVLNSTVHITADSNASEASMQRLAQIVAEQMDAKLRLAGFGGGAVNQNAFTPVGGRA